MTDKLPPLSTPIVPPSQPVFTLPTVAPLQDVAHKQEIVEEEPYTIKCICNFSDDDGNTIYCETCDTWQHIECYYPENVDPASLADFAHSCVDCKPRPLDRKQAIERQLARSGAIRAVEEEATDKKNKRLATKGHKKKPKPTDIQINGHPNGADSSKHGSPHEHQPAKKAKSSHKTSQSISAQAPKRSPSYGNSRVNHGHPPSPVTTPPDLLDEVVIHTYSPGFLSLCNENPASIAQTNSFIGLKVSNAMSEWLRDPEKMQRETGRRYNEVFQKLPPDIDAMKKIVEIQQIKKMIQGNLPVQLRCLKATAPIPKDVPLMELKGEIGFQASYCADPANLYTELSSPLPFVLFHPMLPLYIDTRKEGSEARYVRRSCRPNATLETYLSEVQEYRFWLVSDRQIAAKEEVTIAWDIRFPKADEDRYNRILGLSDEEETVPEPIIEEKDYQELAPWVHRILSEYGGCACGLGNECSFARFHRIYFAQLTARTNPLKKKRKPKVQATISPTSTGHATNSRAPSEGHLDDVPEHDERSASGSSRSKPPSRDMTPVARQGSFDTLGILTEPTDRDKRKVAMVEDSFRRMEQQQPPRKKKRTSDGTAPGTTYSKTKPSKSNSAAQTPSLLNGERYYIDAGTSRSKSGSPVGASSPKSIHETKESRSRGDSYYAASRNRSVSRSQSNYCDAAVQTEPEERPWYDELNHFPPTPPKRRVVSLSRRLLNSRHRQRLDGDENLLGRSTSQESFTVMDIDSPPGSKSLPSPSLSREAEKEPAAASLIVHAPVDTPMPDVPMASGFAKPNTAAVVPGAVKNRSPELRVQLPPVPAFVSPASAVLAVTTPLSAGGTIAQSPLSTIAVQTMFSPTVNGGAVTASPVKKKLSLSDYRQSRMNKSKPMTGATALKPVFGSDEPKSATSATSLENGSLTESPVLEKSSDAVSLSPQTVSTNTQV